MKTKANSYVCFDPYSGYVLGFHSRRAMNNFTAHGFWYFSRSEQRFDANFRKAHARGAYRMYLEGLR